MISFRLLLQNTFRKRGLKFSGQTIQSLIVNSKSKNVDNKVLPAKLLKPKAQYDIPKYLEMLDSSSETLLGVFGYTKNRVCEEALNHDLPPM